MPINNKNENYDWGKCLGVCLLLATALKCWLLPHFLPEMRMAQSKTWPILAKNRTNVWLDNMIGNNSVASEWKETSDCLTLPLAFSGGILFLVVEATNSFVNHSIMNVPTTTFKFSSNFDVPGVVTICKRSGIRISFQCKNTNESEYSTTGEPGNIYESGKISCSVNLV